MQPYSLALGGRSDCLFVNQTNSLDYLSSRIGDCGKRTTVRDFRSSLNRVKPQIPHSLHKGPTATIVLFAGIDVTNVNGLLRTKPEENLARTYRFPSSEQAFCWPALRRFQPLPSPKVKVEFDRTANHAYKTLPGPRHSHEPIKKYLRRRNETETSCDRSSGHFMKIPANNTFVASVLCHESTR